jgi:hypothetical protein
MRGYRPDALPPQTPKNLVGAGLPAMAVCLCRGCRLIHRHRWQASSHRVLGRSHIWCSPKKLVGASLLANAVGQSTSSFQEIRLREQARSHSFFIRQTFNVLPTVPNPGEWRPFPAEQKSHFYSRQPLYPGPLPPNHRTLAWKVYRPCATDPSPRGRYFDRGINSCTLYCPKPRPSWS